MARFFMGTFVVYFVIAINTRSMCINIYTHISQICSCGMGDMYACICMYVYLYKFCSLFLVFILLYKLLHNFSSVDTFRILKNCQFFHDIPYVF